MKRGHCAQHSPVRPHPCLVSFLPTSAECKLSSSPSPGQKATLRVLRGQKSSSPFSAPLRVLRGQKQFAVRSSPKTKNPLPKTAVRRSPRPSASSADKKSSSPFSVPLRVLRGQRCSSPPFADQGCSPPARVPIPSPSPAVPPMFPCSLTLVPSPCRSPSSYGFSPSTLRTKLPLC